MALLDKSIKRRDFLKGAAATAAVAALAGTTGCSSGAGGASGSSQAHVVESDQAIIEGRGKWQGVSCLKGKGCSLQCAPCEYVVDSIAVRAKPADFFEDESLSYNYQLRSCHAAKTARWWFDSVARIKYPMKRKNWQPGGGENVHGELRGKDEWERISWDEALDMCASEIKRIYGTYGPTSTISFISMGTSIQNVLNLMGGYVEINDTISCGVWEGDVMHWGLTNFGVQQCPDPQDWLNADYYILEGFDFTITQCSTGVNYVGAKEAGVQFIYIGPCLNQSAMQLEARWIPVRPGTDTAFWNGVAYEMVKLDEAGEEIIDWDFLAKYTKGFTLDNMPDDAKLDECYMGYLLGDYDDTPKTAEWASRICGAPVEDIRDMARIMGKNNNVMMSSGNAAARATGVENYPHVFFTLGLMGGHIGKPGNAVFNNISGNDHMTHGYTGQQGRSLASTTNPIRYEEQKGELLNAGGAVSRARNLIEAPLHWQNMLEGKYTSYGAHSQSGDQPPIYNSGVEHDIDVKFIWNGTRNFLSMSIDLFNAIKVYRNCEFVLTQQPYASQVARFSDIVLPVATPWEGSLDQSENIWPGGTVNRYVGHDLIPALWPVCEPLWEARSDDRIAREIGERCGLDPDKIAGGNALQSYFEAMAGGRYYTPEKKQEVLLTITQEIIDKYGVDLQPQQGVVDLEQFIEQGGYQVPRSKDDAYVEAETSYKAFVEDPVANPRSSASGLWEIYCQVKADNFNTPNFVDPNTPCKPYPNYYEPTMGYEKTFSDWDNQVKGEYPYLLYTFHPAARNHSSVYSALSQECYPHPLYINPIDAANIGVETGDTVVIRNPVGARILRQVVLMEGTMPGCVGLAEGGTFDLDESDPDNWIDRGGAANVITPAVRSNYMPGLSGYNNGIVAIEKYDGEPVVPDCEKDLFTIDEA